MTLNNRTALPEKLVRRVLIAAAHDAGLRNTSGLVVRVASGRGGGMARGCHRVLAKLAGLKPRKGSNYTDCNGYVEMLWPHLGWPKHPYRDPQEAAEYIYKLSVHEFTHTRDFREGGHTWSHRMHPFTRRPKHDERPEEMRANMQAAWVMANLTEDRKALITELAAVCCPGHVRPGDPACNCGVDQDIKAAANMLGATNGD